MINAELNHTIIFSSTFSKENRLTSKSEIEALFKKGTTIFLFPFKVYFKFAELEGTSAVPKVLISVPKKHFKSAVNRNRLKRLFRESYRIHKHKIQQTTNNKALQIAFLYVHSSALTYEEIEKKLILVINKINQHLPKNE